MKLAVAALIALFPPAFAAAPAQAACVWKESHGGLTSCQTVPDHRPHSTRSDDRRDEHRDRFDPFGRHDDRRFDRFRRRETRCYTRTVQVYRHNRLITEQVEVCEK